MGYRRQPGRRLMDEFDSIGSAADCCGWQGRKSSADEQKSLISGHHPPPAPSPPDRQGCRLCSLSAALTAISASVRHTMSRTSSLTAALGRWTAAYPVPSLFPQSRSLRTVPPVPFTTKKSFRVHSPKAFQGLLTGSIFWSTCCSFLPCFPIMTTDMLL